LSFLKIILLYLFITIKNKKKKEIDKTIFKIIIKRGAKEGV
jgi:hypothetical protein